MAHVPNEWTGTLLWTIELVQASPLIHHVSRILTVNRFNHLHSEPVPSAISRYAEQAHRVLRILNGALEGKSWLVGDKCTYVDLSFFMWNFILAIVMKCKKGESPFDMYPNVKAWHERMEGREAVKKIVEVRQQMIESENLGEDYMTKELSIDEIRERI